MTGQTVSTQMALPEHCVRIFNPHQDAATSEPGWNTYHQWTPTTERVKANVNGHPNPRMYDAQWTKWICNNGDCYAIAIVHDDLARLALEAVSA